MFDELDAGRRLREEQSLGPKVAASYAAELRELKNALQAAQQTACEMGQFLDVLGQELRAPLTPLLTAVQLLRENACLPAALHTYVAVIAENAEAQARLVDDLLDMNLLRAGKLQLTVEEVDSAELVSSTVELFAADAEVRQVSLCVDAAASLPTLRADRARLQQVLRNLLHNALKFCAPGDTVRVSTADSSQGLRIVVADNGAGIDPSVLGVVFRAYAQGEETLARPFGGLGLGLALSKGLVELHGGSIEVDSPGAGQGTAVSVILPSARAVQKTIDVRQLGAVAVTRGTSPRRILLVDDHADTLTLTKMLLERQGYIVETASCAAQAVAAAECCAFDLLISDIGLPDESGLVLLKRLNSSRPIKGIALSGYGREVDVQSSREAGFVEHLTKPINLQRLQQVIEQVFAGDRPQERGDVNLVPRGRGGSTSGNAR